MGVTNTFFPSQKPQPVSSAVISNLPHEFIDQISLALNYNDLKNT